MRVLANVYIPKLFDTVVCLNYYRGFSRSSVTIYHVDCGFSFNALWPTRFSGSCWVDDHARYTCPLCRQTPSENDHTATGYIGECDTSRTKAPINMGLSVVALKDCIDFRWRYEAVIHDVDFTDLRKSAQIWKGVLRFDFKKKSVFLKHGAAADLKSVDWVEIQAGDIRTIQTLPGLRFMDASSWAFAYKTEITGLANRFRKEVETRLESMYGFKPRAYRPLAFKKNGVYVIQELLTNLVWRMQVPDGPCVTAGLAGDLKGVSDLLSQPNEDRFQAFLKGTRNSKPYYKALADAFLEEQLPPSMMKLLAEIPASTIPLFNATKDVIPDVNVRRTILQTLINSISPRPHTGYGILRDQIQSIYQHKQEIKEIAGLFGPAFLSRLVHHYRDDVRTFTDVLQQYRQLQASGKNALQGMLPVKAKALHDVLTMLLYKQEYEDVLLPVLSRVEETIEGLHFFCPPNAAVLHAGGKLLKNCVASYKQRIIDGTSAVVFVDNQEQTPVACIELTKDESGAFTRVVQSKLHCNKASNLDEAINSKILTWMKRHKLRSACKDVGGAAVG